MCCILWYLFSFYALWFSHFWLLKHTHSLRFNGKFHGEFGGLDSYHSWTPSVSDAKFVCGWIFFWWLPRESVLMDWVNVFHLTQNRSFRRQSCQPVSWLSTEENMSVGGLHVVHSLSTSFLWALDVTLVSLATSHTCNRTLDPELILAAHRWLLSKSSTRR